MNSLLFSRAPTVLGLCHGLHIDVGCTILDCFDVECVHGQRDVCADRRLFDCSPTGC